jgi:hypothetical protein
MTSETSNSNIHGNIHGKVSIVYCNAGGVEEYLFKQILFFKINTILHKQVDQRFLISNFLMMLLQVLYIIDQSLLAGKMISKTTVSNMTPRGAGLESGSVPLLSDSLKKSLNILKRFFMLGFN